MKKSSAKGSRGFKSFNPQLKRIEITALIILALLLLYPVFASAQAATATPQQVIRMQIAELLKQVDELQAKLRGLQGGSATSSAGVMKPKRVCPLVARVLFSGSQGDDVKELQEFLAEEGYFDRGNITAYFGPLTESALRKWQAMQGIVSSGDAASTGWGIMGPRTREHMLQRCGGWSNSDDRPVPPPFGTSTWPGVDKKGQGHSLMNGCPVPVMPEAASCDGKLRMGWQSQGRGLKCLEWKCHTDDDADDEDDEDEDDEEDSGDDADDNDLDNDNDEN